MLLLLDHLRRLHFTAHTKFVRIFLLLLLITHVVASGVHLALDFVLLLLIVIVISTIVFIVVIFLVIIFLLFIIILIIAIIIIVFERSRPHLLSLPLLLLLDLLLVIVFVEVKSAQEVLQVCLAFLFLKHYLEVGEELLELEVVSEHLLHTLPL